MYLAGENVGENIGGVLVTKCGAVGRVLSELVVWRDEAPVKSQL